MPQWEWREERTNGAQSWVCEQASGMRAVITLDGGRLHKTLEKTLSHERLVDETEAPSGEQLEGRVERAKRALEARLASVESGHS